MRPIINHDAPAPAGPFSSVKGKYAYKISAAKIPTKAAEAPRTRGSIGACNGRRDFTCSATSIATRIAVDGSKIRISFSDITRLVTALSRMPLDCSECNSDFNRRLIATSEKHPRKSQASAGLWFLVARGSQRPRAKPGRQALYAHPLAPRRHVPTRAAEKCLVGTTRSPRRPVPLGDCAATINTVGNLPTVFVHRKPCHPSTAGDMFALRFGDSHFALRQLRRPLASRTPGALGAPRCWQTTCLPLPSEGWSDGTSGRPGENRVRARLSPVPKRQMGRSRFPLPQAPPQETRGIACPKLAPSGAFFFA
jgi:hypothetical protein